MEKLGCLGGTATAGGINYFLGGRKLDEKSKKHIRVIGGIFDEITDKLISEGNAIEPDTIDLDFNPVGWYPRMASGIVFDELALKILMDDMCEALGIRVYYNSALIDVKRTGRFIDSVIIHNKDGLVSLEAGCFADCTGDADLAALSGCSCLKGRESDGLTTPASLEMHVENVDGNELVRYQNEHQSPKLVEIIERLKKDGIWKFPYEIFVCMQLVHKDVFLINTIRQVCVDGTSEASISKALAQGRKENLELFRIMKEYFPGFKNARIRKVCDFIGIR
ncbi:MAG TPA: FAD-dependent oxidoreductase, partial [Clostridiales bacterium]|nr:FAD-dependent oxidoreductase [Clostridiales bacterium]